MMADKNQLKAIMDAVSESAAAQQTRGGLKSDCCCPLFNVYVIFTNCLTINNGSCPDWDFCDPALNFTKNK
jgi:hypothetical protein